MKSIKNYKERLSIKSCINIQRESPLVDLEALVHQPPRSRSYFSVAFIVLLLGAAGFSSCSKKSGEDKDNLNDQFLVRKLSSDQVLNAFEAKEEDLRSIKIGFIYTSIDRHNNLHMNLKDFCTVEVYTKEHVVGTFDEFSFEIKRNSSTMAIFNDEDAEVCKERPSSPYGVSSDHETGSTEVDDPENIRDLKWYIELAVDIVEISPNRFEIKHDYNYYKERRIYDFNRPARYILESLVYHDKTGIAHERSFTSTYKAKGAK